MWEGVGDRTELQHFYPHYYGHQRFFPVLLGCSTGGLGTLPLWDMFLQHLLPTGRFSNWLIGGLRAPSAGCWLSRLHLISNWLNFLCTELYNSSTSTFFLWASQIALIQPIHGQGYTLLFLDRMLLLFTQVHLLFWLLHWVVGQYTTLGSGVLLLCRDVVGVFYSPSWLDTLVIAFVSLFNDISTFVGYLMPKVSL